MSNLVYQRILLKLSGEALMGSGDYGIDPEVLSGFADDIADLVNAGVEVGLVIGGGNIFRGAGLAARGVDRGTADYMGMLATVINALAMQDALEKTGTPVRVMSALRINQVCEGYIRRRAMRHLEKGRVVICAAGTGNPYFTTDSAASLRAIELDADILIKATKVDGIYTDDPATNPDATLLKELSYDQVIQDKLAVMDTTAVVLCRDQNMPLRVMNTFEKGALFKLVHGESIGSLVQ
ncbi:MAG TPA: UMP kinase [Chromatiaceae bacterium]|jgi:uridylate kinase|nr:UMP kinase [Chromatiaceae bacterium]HIB84623.1 UMP kinase [Chromatiaceae bacterium]HIN81307.1 UMP kinase [Chromatiales bacterium]HIO14557.1 UMP kinase [Chromatiales bacterium]HIO53521.1 UMP kinase [Chromatiales bacterium]